MPNKMYTIYKLFTFFCIIIYVHNYTANENFGQELLLDYSNMTKAVFFCLLYTLKTPITYAGSWKL